MRCLLLLVMLTLVWVTLVFANEPENAIDAESMTRRIVELERRVTQLEDSLMRNSTAPLGRPQIGVVPPGQSIPDSWSRHEFYIVPLTKARSLRE